MPNCNECKSINITEQEQIFYFVNRGIMFNHMCVRHFVKVIHRNSNPKISHDYIYPCAECKGKDFKKK